MTDGSKSNAGAKMKIGADERMTSAGAKRNAEWKTSAGAKRKCAGAKKGRADYWLIVGFRRRDKTEF